MTEQIHKADFDMVFGHRDLRRSYLYLYCQEQMDVVGSLSGSSSLPLMMKAKNLILFE
jgi:hypothetical protein